MICVPISRNSRGSIALTLPCVPTDMNTGVSTTPWAVVNRPSRAFELGSVFNNSNILARFGYSHGGDNRKFYEVRHKGLFRPSAICQFAVWVLSRRDGCG